MRSPFSECECWWGIECDRFCQITECDRPFSDVSAIASAVITQTIVHKRMSGIDRELTLDTKHIAKHLPDTPQMQKLLQQEGSVHLFNDEATMLMVAQAIVENGEFTGIVRSHQRYGLYFPQPIGYRLSQDGSNIPLYYGEMKVKGDKYHVIPRTRPSR